MRTTVRRWPRLGALYGAGLGFAGGIVATVGSAAGGLVEPLSAPVLMVAVVSAVTTVAGALLAGLQSWLLYASFILGHGGELALSGASVHSAAVLAGTAAIATAVGAAIGWIQKPSLVSVPCQRSAADFTSSVLVSTGVRGLGS
ncbi:hypothetical protein [Kibdelosporangium phytohabitans]|uniref:Uncharacterized protein n=1 Tax=Kibdelosporangium phytohabitans TaxID=860235 RepID=A0A0N7F3N7_9PSEU|nr:hypothetical protein [Kibdelosporangium phytohabitans]ALG09143.1 hypothetical protein AOZ06_21505 [Kibdelosporangium phytohabitans]MBE1469637.1 hypothetical protein [Kibdelosporangium phytohabitans]